MYTKRVIKNFSLAEYEEKVIEGLDSTDAEKILKTGIVDVGRRFSGEFVLKADSKVGFISLEDVQVNITPRFPIYNIFYLLGLVDALKLDKQKVLIEESRDFLTVLFQTFLQSVSDATRKGLLNGYVNLHETSQVLKGRLDFGSQFKRHLGKVFPFEISYDDFVEDVPENQILKLALRKSLKYGIREQSLRNIAHNLLYSFKGVSDIQGQQKWNLSRLNKHYWDALKLAELIIGGQGFDESLGNVQINGFSIEMHKVFEDFVAKQFSIRVNNQGGSIVTQKRLALDLDEVYVEKPDIVWYENSKPFQVIDTKYKKPEGQEGQRDSINDLRQVISYASLLGLKEAHLVYGVAGGARSIQTRQEGITVFTHGLDLGKSPLEIQSQLDSLVEKLRASS